MLFILSFSPEFPVSKLQFRSSHRDSGRSGAVQRSDFLTLCPPYLLGYAWSLIRPQPSSGFTWFRTSLGGGGVCKQKAAMDTRVTWHRHDGHRQVCCSGVSPAGCSIVPETRRDPFYLSPVGPLRVSARWGETALGGRRRGMGWRGVPRCSI